MKIISLAPTQTEIVAALGCRRELVGISEDCDYPPWVKEIQTFGSWAYPDLNSVLTMEPDLVCTFGKHQEEVSAWLSERKIPVFHSDPSSIAESLSCIEQLAERIGRGVRGKSLLDALRKRLARIRERVKNIPFEKRPRVFRIMHWDPLITVGAGAFQHDVIEHAGGINVAADGPAAYFRCDVDMVLDRDPDFIFFCEPSLRDKVFSDERWRNCRALRRGMVRIFDCGLTCRSGPRIVDMVEQLHEQLFPDLEAGSE